MFSNYLIVALRHIARHKLYSFINIAGLAMGLACLIFVMAFIRDELSFDRWVPGTQTLYRLEKIARPPGRAALDLATTPFPFAAIMRDNIPEVRAITRLTYIPMSLFAGDRPFRERVAEVDPNFFQVIQLPLLQGNAANILRDPESVVISQSAALKYFGTTDAIGKVIRTTAKCESGDTACTGRMEPLKVTGILRDIPHNSHLDGDVFIPNISIVDRIGLTDKESWFSNATFGYILLAPGARSETVIAKMGPLLDRFIPSEQIDHQKGSQRYQIDLTPFIDVHLDSARWRGNETPAGSRVTLAGVGVIGLLILFTACFNFMNLATAQVTVELKPEKVARSQPHREAAE